MTVYHFNLIVGYMPTGVDYAQGYRAKLLRKIGEESQFVFTELPKWHYVKYYSQQVGLLEEEMTSIHYSFLDNASLFPQLSLAQVQKIYPEINEMDEVLYDKQQIFYSKGGHRLLAIQFIEAGSDIVDFVSHYAEGKLIRQDFYTNRLLYSEYFYPSHQTGSLAAKVYRRIYYKADKSFAFEEICDGVQSRFLFPNQNEILNKHDLIAKYLRQLELKKSDWILLDRSSDFDFAQAILKEKGEAKLAAVIHSEHYFSSNYDPSYLYLNYEYYYLMKYADKFNCFITSTEVQRQAFQKKIWEESHVFASVKVIPVGSSEEKAILPNAFNQSRMMTASRLQERKQVDWLIKAAAIAKKQIPNLTFDIFGEGHLKSDYQKLIKELEAEDYIHLRGHVDLSQVYQEHSLYVSSSMWETFGLTLLEAVSNGLALIGLDVPYGNQTFIEDGKNGFLVDCDYDENSEVTIALFAQKIVTYFSQTVDAKKAMQEHSIILSKQFTEDKLLAAWSDLLS